MWKKYKFTWYLVATSLGWWSGRMCRWDCSTFCRPRWGSQRSHPPASVTQINQSIHSNWPFRKLNLIKKFQLILFTSRQLIISFSNADLMSLFYFNRIRIRAQHFSSDPDPNWTKFLYINIIKAWLVKPQLKTRAILTCFQISAILNSSYLYFGK